MNVVRLDIPATCHPATIRGKSEAQDHARAALTTLYEVYGTINDTAAKVKDKARLATAAKPVAERALTRVDKTIGDIVKSREKIARQIDEALSSKSRDSINTQVRDHFRRLEGKGAAVKAINERIAAGDLVTVTAVLQGPAYLSGLTDKEYKTVRDRAELQFCAENVVLRNEADDALTRLAQARTAMIDDLGPRFRTWEDADGKAIDQLRSAGNE